MEYDKEEIIDATIGVVSSSIGLLAGIVMVTYGIVDCVKNGTTPGNLACYTIGGLMAVDKAADLYDILA